MRSHGGSDVTAVLGFVSWKEWSLTRGAPCCWFILGIDCEAQGWGWNEWTGVEGRPVKDTLWGRSLLFVSSKDLLPRGSLWRTVREATDLSQDSKVQKRGYLYTGVHLLWRRESLGLWMSSCFELSCRVCVSWRKHTQKKKKLCVKGDILSPQWEMPSSCICTAQWQGAAGMRAGQGAPWWCTRARTLKICFCMHFVIFKTS